MSRDHGRSCTEEPCDYCQNLAEDHAYDWEPRYDPSAAATQYERYFDGGAS
jgi:hypothetical protein